MKRRVKMLPDRVKERLEEWFGKDSATIVDIVHTTQEENPRDKWYIVTVADDGIVRIFLAEWDFENEPTLTLRKRFTMEVK
jgi:hypothetical protein